MFFVTHGCWLQWLPVRMVCMYLLSFDKVDLQSGFFLRSSSFFLAFGPL